MIRKSLFIIICGVQVAFACTAFGTITKNGTIIGKNRDYFYNPQSFVKVMPVPKFSMWYDNPFEHSNKFYAITSNGDVKMGVNENGLTAIEEDPAFPEDFSKHRRFTQPINGNSEGTVLYGVLQNFNTVNEIKPYIKQIFSIAAPNFYQFADSKQILTVEVAYGKNDSDKTRDYKYQLVNKLNDYFTHANTYLNKKYINLNDLNDSKDALNGTKNRLRIITDDVRNAKSLDIDTAQAWFLDTKSDVSSKKQANWCLNTSVFRSNLQDLSEVNLAQGDGSVYGTVSSLIVKNTGNHDTTQIYVRMLDSIKIMPDGSQLIKYKDINITLFNLFSAKTLQFIDHDFTRQKPVNNTCQ